MREKKAELAKTEKPRGTTGIAINDRITWWQKMVAKKSDVKTPKKAKKAKKKKRKGLTLAHFSRNNFDFSVGIGVLRIR